MMVKVIKQRKILHRVLVMLLSVVMVMAASVEVLAAGQVEVDREGRMNFVYSYNGKNLEGAKFYLYRVADMSSAGKYSLSGDFKEYPVLLDNLDSTGWKVAANTLAAYISVDKIVPLKVGISDAQGKVQFESLPTGLYLLKVDDIEIGKNTFRSAPSLISLPSLGGDDAWNYEVEALPKTSMESNDKPATPSGGSGEGKVKITVIKVWNDEGYREQRPKGIEAALLRDGEEYSSVTLSSSNYWRHTWSGLSDNHTWEVIERDIPAEYSVTYTDESTVYTITNSVLEDILDDDVPRGGYVELPDGEVPLLGLPQTGLLWWPVPLLSMGGLLLFGLGFKDYFRKRSNDEK